MSYTIDIVAAPLPESDKEAWLFIHALREKLYAHPGAPSPRMRELYDRLTARHPCITVDANGPWSDGPLINNFGETMAILGIAGGLWLAKTDPALLAERMRPMMQSDQPTADKKFMLVFGFVALIWFDVFCPRGPPSMRDRHRR